MYRGADGRGVSCHHSALVAIAFLFDGCFVLTTPDEITRMPVGWEAIGGCGNICFGHVLDAVRQGQRRDTVAPGEARFGRCTEGQMAGVSAFTTVRS